MSIESQNEVPEARQEALWMDKGMVTLSFRRHTSYERDPNSGNRGALISKENVAAADSAAYNFAKHLPQGSEVSFYQSPSFMVARKLENGHEIKPMRAATTASRYEQAIRGSYGNYASRRNFDSRLGDIFEHGNNQIPLFFKALKENYGGMSPDFWDDYINGTLKPEVAEAFKKANGSDPEALAHELTEFVGGAEKKLRTQSGQTPDFKKEVGLVITHGEKLESYLFYLTKYLQIEGQDVSVLQETIEQGVDNNQGFDIHLNPEGKAFLQLGGKLVEYDQNQFASFLTVEEEHRGEQA